MHFDCPKIAFALSKMSESSQSMGDWLTACPKITNKHNVDGLLLFTLANSNKGKGVNITKWKSNEFQQNVDATKYQSVKLIRMFG